MSIGKQAIALINKKFGGRVTHDSGHTKTGPTLIVTFPKALGEYQVAIRDNKNKLTCYLNRRTLSNERTEDFLPPSARVEELYPKGDYRIGDNNKKPANSLLDESKAPFLTPRRNDLIRVTLEMEDLEVLLHRYLHHSASPLADNSDDTLTALRQHVEQERRQIELETRDLKTGEREAMVRQRIGQGVFRDLLFRVQGGACCITGIPDKQLLVASHIKPWSACDQEPDARGDENNGLLLSVHWDALFDKGLITFDVDWSLIVSRRLSETARQHLGIKEGLLLAATLRTVRRTHFLEYHRDSVFNDSNSGVPLDAKARGG